MDEILNFIMKYCRDLYMKYGFRFVDSEVSNSFNNALIILENEYLKLQFTRDRSQLFLWVHSSFDKKENNWYTFDLIRQLITGEKEYYSLLDDKNGQFIQKNVDRILALFKQDVVEDTLIKLGRLEKIRTKQLFK